MLHCNIFVLAAASMETNESFGMYLRLQRELMEAYVARICDHGRIERLTDELAAVRRVIDKQGVLDEQSSNTTIPGVLR